MTEHRPEKRAGERERNAEREAADGRPKHPEPAHRPLQPMRKAEEDRRDPNANDRNEEASEEGLLCNASERRDENDLRRRQCSRERTELRMKRARAGESRDHRPSRDRKRKREGNPDRCARARRDEGLQAQPWRRMTKRSSPARAPRKRNTRSEHDRVPKKEPREQTAVRHRRDGESRSNRETQTTHPPSSCHGARPSKRLISRAGREIW